MNIKNISKNLTLLLIVVNIVRSQSCDANGVCSSNRKYCLQSNDCGTLPYGDCTKPTFCITNPGIGLSSLADGVLYYSEYCSVANTGYTTLNRIDRAGGNPSAVATLNADFPTILGLYQNQVFYRSNNPSSFFFSYDLSSQSIKQYPLPAGITTITSLSFGGSDYYAIGLSSSSSYQVLSIKGPLSTVSNTASVLYNLGSQVYGVNVIVAPNNALYFNSNETIYRLDQRYSPYVPTVVHSITDLNSFSYSNGYLYLATSHGLFTFSLSQKVETRIRPIIESAYFSVVPDSNRLYFNTFYDVRSIDFMGGNNYLVTQTNLGVCTCRPNFSGGDCKSCSGQVQWGDDGSPNCVSRDANGVPATCSQDYQCGNVPYSICSNNRCTCRPNFSEANCRKCAGQVTWSQDGIPTCN